MTFQILLMAVIAYGLLVLGLFTFQERMVFFPTREHVADPGQVGLEYMDVWLESSTTERAHAWLVPAPENGRGLAVVFCHGNGGNVSHRLDTLRILHDLGLETLLFDYRGYGKSDGRPGEKAAYRDAQAAWEYLERAREWPPERIVVWGRSLGGAVAARLAASHSDDHSSGHAGKRSPAACVMESSFTSIPDMAAWLYPFLPGRWLARIRFPAKRFVAKASCPVLVVHSPDDETVPMAMGRELFAASPEPKSFVEISGRHDDGFIVSCETYVKGVKAFLDAHIPYASPKGRGLNEAPARPAKRRQRNKTY